MFRTPREPTSRAALRQLTILPTSHARVRETGPCSGRARSTPRCRRRLRFPRARLAIGGSGLEIVDRIMVGGGAPRLTVPKAHGPGDARTEPDLANRLTHEVSHAAPRALGRPVQRRQLFSGQVDLGLCHGCQLGWQSDTCQVDGSTTSRAIAGPRWTNKKIVAALAAWRFKIKPR